MVCPGHLDGIRAGPLRCLLGNMASDGQEGGVPDGDGRTEGGAADEDVPEERSPIFNVYPVGSSKPLAFVDHPHREIVTLAVPPPTDGSKDARSGFPEGSLLVVPVDPAEGNELRVALANIVYAIGEAAENLDSGSMVVRAAPDFFLRQFQLAIRMAGQALDALPVAESLSERKLQARSLIAELGDWATRSALSRSGHPASNPLTIPSPVIDRASSIELLGRELQLALLEVPRASSEDDGLEADLAEHRAFARRVRDENESREEDEQFERLVAAVTDPREEDCDTPWGAWNSDEYREPTDRPELVRPRQLAALWIALGAALRVRGESALWLGIEPAEAARACRRLQDAERAQEVVADVVARRAADVLRLILGGTWHDDMLDSRTAQDVEKRLRRLRQDARPVFDRLGWFVLGVRAALEHRLRGRATPSLEGCVDALPAMESASEPPAGTETGEDVVEDAIALRCPDPAAAARVRRALDSLQKPDVAAWIPRSSLREFGIPDSTVERDWERRRSESDRRGGGPSLANVSYRTGYLIEFVEQRWKPRNG